MTKVTKKISFQGQTVYVGIDVHKKQWMICVLTEDVNFRPFSIDPDPEILISYLVKNFPHAEYCCAYEAGFSGYSLYEALWEAGLNVWLYMLLTFLSLIKRPNQK